MGNFDAICETAGIAASSKLNGRFVETEIGRADSFVRWNGLEGRIDSDKFVLRVQAKVLACEVLRKKDSNFVCGLLWDEYFSRKGAKTQRRKEAKGYRVSNCFLCVFAPLRETSSPHKTRYAYFLRACSEKPQAARTLLRFRMLYPNWSKSGKAFDSESDLMRYLTNVARVPLGPASM